jgi:hypothetical protein
MLLRSLDAEEGREVDEAWAAEVARRIADTNAGRVKLMPWRRARRRLLCRPSTRSLREIPEVDFRTVSVRSNRYGRRITTGGLIVQVGRARRKQLLGPGGTRPRSVRLSADVWALLDQRARAKRLTFHTALPSHPLVGAWRHTERVKT